MTLVVDHNLVLQAQKLSAGQEHAVYSDTNIYETSANIYNSEKTKENPDSLDRWLHYFTITERRLRAFVASNRLEQTKTFKQIAKEIPY